jgi:UDP-N-acetylglucosamine 2-epimerase (non-hydrolysing)
MRCCFASIIGISKMMKFLVVAGARPNFMKIAPIMEAFRDRRQHSANIEVLLVHTGQHYDQKMSDDFFADLQIPAPDINLGVGSGSHAQQTARIMIAFEEVCLQQRPEWVIVVGDVNSTLACTITAKKLGIRVAHVEAGLRSYDMSMPEEINRLCTDVIADLLFTTDTLADQNLRREGIPENKIHFVGNTMIDTLLRHIERARSMPVSEGLPDGAFAVLTLHRPGNVDHCAILSGIIGAVTDIAHRIPIVFPAHPRTLGRLEEFGLLERLQNEIHLTQPLSYLPFLGLVARCSMVLTDSGGIQEETTVLGIPCITMRPNTERPITCELGTNQLVGTDPARIRAAAFAVLDGRSRPFSIPEKWDGHAAARIVDILLDQPSAI